MTVINFIQDHSDWTQAILLNVLTIGATFTTIEAELKITLLLISIAFTLYKWFHDWRDREQKRRKEINEFK